MESKATLKFNLPNEVLAFVVEELQKLLPGIFYQQAWRTFNDEQKRRQEKGHPMPMPILLSAAIYEDLPQQVKGRLSPCRDTSF